MPPGDADVGTVLLFAGRVPLIGARRSLRPGEPFPVQTKPDVRHFLAGLAPALKKQLKIDKVDVMACGFDKLPVRIARGSIDRDTGEVRLVD